MILAIDMGNTNIKIGLVEDPENVYEERVTTARAKTSLEYAQDILAVMNFHDVRLSDIKGAILCSVVPALTGVVTTAVRKVIKKQPVLVSSSMKMDIGLNMFRYPKSIGCDLIAGMEAAYYFYEPPCIAVNMGTATTITVVNDDAEYMGGVFLPGMRTSLDALTAHAALLPEISLENPGRVISRNTEHCIRSGVIYGNAAQIDGLIERIEDELGRSCTLVATGGMARFVVQYCKRKIIRDDMLIMKGLWRLYELNAGTVSAAGPAFPA